MCKRLRDFALALLITTAATAAAHAQQLIPYATARLTWDWTVGTSPGVNDGAVTEFRMKCGPKPGSYVTITPVKDPTAREVFVRNVVPANGLYYCAVTAVNDYGESAPSNEVFFSAGAVPSSPANLTLR